MPSRSPVAHRARTHALAVLTVLVLCLTGCFADTKVGDGQCVFPDTFQGDTHTLKRSLDGQPTTTGRCAGECENAHGMRLVGYEHNGTVCKCFAVGLEADALDTRSRFSPASADGMAFTECFASRPHVRVDAINRVVSLEPIGRIRDPVGPRIPEFDTRPSAYRTWDLPQRFPSHFASAKVCEITAAGCLASAPNCDTASSYFTITRDCWSTAVAFGGTDVSTPALYRSPSNVWRAVSLHVRAALDQSALTFSTPDPDDRSVPGGHNTNTTGGVGAGVEPGWLFEPRGHLYFNVSTLPTHSAQECASHVFGQHYIHGAAPGSALTPPSPPPAPPPITETLRLDQVSGDHFTHSGKVYIGYLNQTYGGFKLTEDASSRTEWTFGVLFLNSDNTVEVRHHLYYTAADENTTCKHTLVQTGVGLGMYPRAYSVDVEWTFTPTGDLTVNTILKIDSVSTVSTHSFSGYDCGTQLTNHFGEPWNDQDRPRWVEGSAHSTLVLDGPRQAYQVLEEHVVHVEHAMEEHERMAEKLRRRKLDAHEPSRPLRFPAVPDHWPGRLSTGMGYDYISGSCTAFHTSVPDDFGLSIARVANPAYTHHTFDAASMLTDKTAFGAHSSAAPMPDGNVLLPRAAMEFFGGVNSTDYATANCMDNLVPSTQTGPGENQLCIADNTRASPNQWLQIDLGTPREVAGVVIYNGLNAPFDRLYTHHVRIGNTAREPRTDSVSCYHSAPITATDRGPLVEACVGIGRYVWVDQLGEGDSDNQLNFREVFVYGPTPATTEVWRAITTPSVAPTQCPIDMHRTVLAVHWGEGMAPDVGSTFDTAEVDAKSNNTLTLKPTSAAPALSTALLHHATGCAALLGSVKMPTPSGTSEMAGLLIGVQSGSERNYAQITEYNHEVEVGFTLDPTSRELRLTVDKLAATEADVIDLHLELCCPDEAPMDRCTALGLTSVLDELNVSWSAGATAFGLSRSYTPHTGMTVIYDVADCCEHCSTNQPPSAPPPPPPPAPSPPPEWLMCVDDCVHVGDDGTVTNYTKNSMCDDGGSVSTETAATADPHCQIGECFTIRTQFPQSPFDLLYTRAMSLWTVLTRTLPPYGRIRLQRLWPTARVAAVAAAQPTAAPTAGRPGRLKRTRHALAQTGGVRRRRPSRRTVRFR